MCVVRYHGCLSCGLCGNLCSSTHLIRVPPSYLLAIGGSITVLFTESDVSGSESTKFNMTAPVRVTGNNDGPVTLVVVPLTVNQYSNQPEMYGRSCDMANNSVADPAEGNVI